MGLKEIIKPSQLTFFVAYNENDTDPHYGSVSSIQEMVTSKANLFTTQNEEEWLAELNKYQIDPHI